MRLRCLLSCVLAVVTGLLSANAATRASHVLSVSGSEIRYDGAPIKLIGLRLSNALMSDKTTQELIDHLGALQSYGVNTVSVYVMGSRFGDVKGFRPDASLDPVYAARLARILDAADARAMVVLGGSL